MLRNLSFCKNQVSHPMLRRTLVLSAAMLLAAGCKVGPDYVAPPAPKVQSDWSAKTAEIAQGVAPESARVHNELPALDDWWTVFHDETLNLLLKTVNEQNLDIKMAAQRIYQAEMDYRYARGDLFPKLGTDAAFGRQMQPGYKGGPKHTYGSSWNWEIAAASWEVDVFGQLKRYMEAYDAAWQATAEDLNNVKVLLLAEAARTYINARLAQEEERIALADIQAQETYLEKIVARKEVGKDSDVELVQTQANLATVKASLPKIQYAFNECVNRLSTLMGASPETVREILLRNESFIPNAPDAVAVGIPADILRRRPDIRALERRLAQQTALVGAVQAELYPKFYIDGSFGLQAENIDDLFDGQSLTASIMPRLQWRIFEFGRVRCSIAKQESVTEEMRLEYQYAVLQASEEVNNAIMNYVKLQDQYDEQLEAVKNYNEALKLSYDLYETGKREYMVVLDSQRYRLSNQLALASVHAQLASSVVTLYTALGGGWQTDPQSSASMSDDYLRASFVPGSQIQMSAPGESINQQGTSAQRGLPENVQYSTKPQQSYSTDLPPEGNRSRRNGRTPAPAPQPMGGGSITEFPNSPSAQSIVTQPSGRIGNRVVR
ncbi:MAG: TolC family protein [Thermoguttaceae bacterium]|nr:TolC family protein [Thermoguttaceae bacterium]